MCGGANKDITVYEETGALYIALFLYIGIVCMHVCTDVHIVNDHKKVLVAEGFSCLRAYAHV